MTLSLFKAGSEGGPRVLLRRLRTLCIPSILDLCLAFTESVGYHFGVMRSPTKSRNAVLALLLVTAIAVVGIALWRGDSLPHVDNKNGRIAPLIVGQTVSMQNALIPVAEKRDYFTKAGVAVTLTQFSSGKDSLDALISRATDVSIASDANIVRAVAKGERLVVLGTVDSTYAKLVTRQPIRSGTDLVGKRIGMTVGTVADRYLELLLKNVPQGVNAVNVVNLRAPELVLAFTRGSQDLDGILTWEPFAAQAVRNVPGASVRSSEGVYRFHFFVVTRPDVIDRKGASLKAFVEALSFAQDYLVSDREKVQAFLAEYLQIDLSIVQDLWREHDYTLRLTDDIRADVRSLAIAGTPLPNLLFDASFLRVQSEENPPGG